MLAIIIAIAFLMVRREDDVFSGYAYPLDLVWNRFLDWKDV